MEPSVSFYGVEAAPQTPQGQSHENGVSEPPAILYHPSLDPLSMSACLFVYFGGWEFGARMKMVRCSSDPTRSRTPSRDHPYVPDSCCL